MNITELRAEATKIYNQAHAAISAAKDDEKLAEGQRMLADADRYSKQADTLEQIEERQRSFEAAADRLPVETTEVEERKADTSGDTFRSYLRGQAGVAELRAQGISTDEAGGFTVPKGFLPNVLVALKAYGPMNEGVLPTVITTSSGNTISIPTFDDTTGIGSLVAEGDAAPDASVKFGQLELTARKYTTGVIKISRELLQDTAVDIVGIIETAMAERMGRVLNKHFTVGSGSGQPQGIVTGAGVGHTSIAAGAISVEDFVHMQHSIDSAYRPGAVWQGSDAIIKAARLLKDADGNLIWRPGLSEGEPATILGRKYFVNSDMDGVVSGGAPLLYGDFKKAYTVRKVRDFGLARLDELFAVTDQVGFVGFGRYDGGVTDARAMKKLVIA